MKDTNAHPTLTVLGRKNSANVQKVLWCLAELELPYSQENVGGPYGRNRTPPILSLNPHGLIPILIDGEFEVWESNTILRYLADKFGPTAWYPVEPRRRSRSDRWMDWQLGTLNQAFTPLFVGLVRTPAEKRDYSLIASYRGQAEELFSLLDVALAGSAYLAGAEPTIADIACGVFAYRWFELGMQRPAETPHLKRWYDSLTERCGYRDHVMTGLS
jgi:glutathione S-transferase